MYLINICTFDKDLLIYPKDIKNKVHVAKKSTKVTSTPEFPQASPSICSTFRGRLYLQEFLPSYTICGTTETCSAPSGKDEVDKRGERAGGFEPNLD